MQGPYKRTTWNPRSVFVGVLKRRHLEFINEHWNLTEK